MRATKAGSVDAWAEANSHGYVRFDYSGHGESDGAFEDGTISRWLEEAVAVLERYVKERPIFGGSSLGGWVSLLVARHSLSRGPRLHPQGSCSSPRPWISPSGSCGTGSRRRCGGP